VREGSSSAGAWALVLGVLSAVTVPVAVAATRYSGSYDLMHAGFAIPFGIALGAGAVALARRARRRGALEVTRTASTGRARAGRALGILGIAIASSATVSLAVYGVLTYLGNR
jgi:peptidoglycan/LPS O-acetylase OafA/YrhL